MKVSLILTLLVVSCGVVGIAAQQPGKTVRATGRVLSVTANSLTVRPGPEALTVAVDASTRITGKGVSDKIRSLRAENRSAQLTDLVEANDSVVVEYRNDEKGTARATRIDVRVKAFKKK